MANGAWSNEQLNQIFVYDAQTGTLILRIDSDGLYYYNVENGSYFKVSISPFAVDGAAVAAFFEPGESSVPGVVFDTPGYIIGGENTTNGPGITAGSLVLLSPQITDKTYASIALVGQTNVSAIDNSSIIFESAYLFGQYGNQIGLGNTDFNAGSYTSPTFTGTEIAADYSAAFYGDYDTSRRYMGLWSGTVQSSVAGDRVGLRIYTGPNNNNLTGATQIYDYGQITIAAANVPQPFHVAASFVGVPGKNLLLGARRASGSGTCFLTINARHTFDAVNL